MDLFFPLSKGIYILIIDQSIPTTLWLEKSDQPTIRKKFSVKSLIRINLRNNRKKIRNNHAGRLESQNDGALTEPIDQN